MSVTKLNRTCCICSNSLNSVQHFYLQIEVFCRSTVYHGSVLVETLVRLLSISSLETNLYMKFILSPPEERLGTYFWVGYSNQIRFVDFMWVSCMTFLLNNFKWSKLCLFLQMKSVTVDTPKLWHKSHRYALKIDDFRYENCDEYFWL